MIDIKRIILGKINGKYVVANTKPIKFISWSERNRQLIQCEKKLLFWAWWRKY